MNNKELQKTYQNCLEFCEKIKNPILKDVAKRVFADYKTQLFNKPATTSHHFFKGGLLYHIYCVARNAIAICELYPTLQVDMDLIIFGALTHDIGKTQELKDFDMITDGDAFFENGAQLLGHSYEGAHIIENYLNEYKLDRQFKNQVLHMIGSHMKEYSEGGVLVLPKMLEVVIINFADHIDADLQPAHTPLEKTKKGEEYKAHAPRPYFKSLNDFYNTDR